MRASSAVLVWTVMSVASVAACSGSSSPAAADAGSTPPAVGYECDSVIPAHGVCAGHERVECPDGSAFFGDVDASYPLSCGIILPTCDSTNGSGVMFCQCEHVGGGGVWVCPI